MTPYLAILKDSFREALASRILWILFLAITLFLIAVALAHVDVEVNWPLKPRDIRDADLLAMSIAEEAHAEDPSPGKHIWSLLDSESRERIETAKDNPDSIESAQLAEALNPLLERADFYNNAAWERFRLVNEARDFVRAGPDSLNANELLQLNRRLLEMAYPASVAPSSGEAYYLAYLTWRVPEPVATTQKDWKNALGLVLASVLDILVGTIGVMIAVLVTASMIPNTFDAGAIDLLLSKPVSRVLLFLTKFLGGCVFILLNAAYFLSGLWLIVGWRMGVWDSGLLLSIPVFLFLFAIYYAVSALAGVIWRNAIVCVVMTILFWALCATVGQTREVINLLAILPSRLVRLVPVEDGFIARRNNGTVVAWSAADSDWVPTFEPLPSAGANREFSGGPLGPAASMIGPVYDAGANRLVGVPVRRLANREVPEGQLVVGTQQSATHWDRLPGISIPRNTGHLFVTPEHGLIGISNRGVFRFADELTVAATQAADTERFGTSSDGEGAQEPEASEPPYDSIGVDPWLSLSSTFAVAMNPTSGALAFYDRQVVTVLETDAQGDYSQMRSMELEADDQGVVGFAGDHVIVATARGEVIDVDVRTLEVAHRSSPFGEAAAHHVAASPNGKRFAILFHNEKACLYDADEGKISEERPARQGDLSALTWTKDGALLMADGRGRVWEQDVDEGTAALRYSPKLSRFKLAYYYVINPVYICFPKPGALGNLVAYLLLDQQSVSTSLNNDRLDSARVKIDIWTPIWSNLAFVAVVLTLGSLYVSRKDF